MAHAGAAVQFQTATFLISEEQADAITQAGARVAKHYDIAVLDPKWQDWLKFAGVLTRTYGGMAMAYMAERRGGQPQSPAAPHAANGAIPAVQADDARPVMPQPFHSGAVN